MPLRSLEMNEPFFNLDFLRSTTTTFLGAGLALLIALGVRWLATREAGKTTGTRQRQLAMVLRDTIRQNLEIAEAAKDISDEQILDVNIDLSVLDSTQSLKYDLLGDIELNRDIDEVRFQLATLHRLVDLRLGVEYSPLLAMSNLQSIRANLNSDIRDRARRAEEYEAGKQVVKRLQAIIG